MTDAEHHRKLERLYAAAPVSQWYGTRISIADGHGDSNSYSHRNCYCHSDTYCNGDAYTNGNSCAAGDTDTQTSSNTATSRVSWRASNG